MKYIIELQPQCWLADWEGDPGRTLKIESAKTFTSYTGAKHFLALTKERNKHRSFLHAKIEPTE